MNRYVGHRNRGHLWIRRDGASMQVTLLGTGSAFPSGDRVQSGTLVERDGDRLLVDCGSGILHRIGALAGVTELDIDTVLLTHHHLDHVSDIPGLVKARELKDTPEFTVVGPPGTRGVCDSLLAVDDIAERAAVTVDEFDPDERRLDVGPFTVTMAEGTHSKRSFSYRFGDGLTVCGDTTVNDAVIDLADGCHTLVHECSYPDGVETETHTTPSELADALAGIDLERLYLSHLFPQTEAIAADVERTVADRLDAEVAVATDLTTFTVPG